MRDLSPFLKLLTAYLSRNTLHTVCPWLADLVSMTVSRGEATPAAGTSSEEAAHSYKPPLPNITTRPLSSFIQVHHHSPAQLLHPGTSPPARSAPSSRYITTRPLSSFA